MVETTGAAVTGIDLTPHYKAVGEALNAAVGLDGNPVFVTGSALEMPFGNDSFDAAYLIHAGMNIRDKKGLYEEVARVLRPGGVFGVYDIMAGENVADLQFPVPWAETQDTSFLVSPPAVETLLTQAGFEIAETENRSDFGWAALEKLLEHGAERVRDEDFKPKARNLLANIENGFCAPWQMIAHKAG